MGFNKTTKGGDSLVSLDPNSTTLAFYDDFTAATNPTTNGWLQATNGTGAASNKLVGSSVPDHGMGWVDITTGTTTTGRSLIYRGNTTEFKFGAGVVTWIAKIYLPDLSDATDEYDIYAGIHNGLTGAPGHGVYFQYDRNTSVNWYAANESAASVTAEDTGVAVAADAVIRLKIICDITNSSTKFYINDALTNTITANFPSNATLTPNSAIGIFKSAGTTARSLYLDFNSVSKTN